MRKVIYSMNVSLDGFIEDRAGGLDWSVPSPELHQFWNDQEREYDLFLYGRRLYETMSAFWPTAGLDPSDPPEVVEFARIWRSTPKLVFSHTLAEVRHNARLATGGIVEEVTRLKAQPGKDISVGGAGLAASLMAAGLIDEFRPVVHPVLLGGGKPMFPGLDAPGSLELVETRRIAGGYVLLRYQRSSA